MSIWGGDHVGRNESEGQIPCLSVSEEGNYLMLDLLGHKDMLGEGKHDGGAGAVKNTVGEI